MSDLPDDRTLSQLFKVGMLANVFEWYEFCIYGYLATAVSVLFFNAQDPIWAVTQTFLLLSISYCIRPLGSLAFARLSDRYGRARSLSLSLWWMSLPTALLGLLPTYDHVGIGATVCLAILRLIQGFASGGELPCSMCYVFESAPLKRRTFLCSAVSASALAGVMLASLVVTVLHRVFSSHAILAYAWRIPFLLGIPLTMMIAFMRRGLSEPAALSSSPNASTPQQSTQPFWFNVLILSALISYLEVYFYILLVWMPTYLQVFLSVPATTAYTSNLLALGCNFGITLASGYFSRGLSHLKMLVISIVLTLLGMVPLFLWLMSKTLAAIYGSQLLFAALIGVMNGRIVEILGCHFSRADRSQGMSIAFTCSAAWFGGSAPTICLFILHKTHFLGFPAFYVMGFGVIALVALKYLDRSTLTQTARWHTTTIHPTVCDIETPVKL